MTNKTLGIALVVIVIIALGGYVFPSVQNSVIERIVGGSAGPERTDSCESTNGVQKCWERKKLNVATTTPCAIKSPAATSTLLSASLQVQTSTTTATVWTLAKAATAFATTTQFSQYSLGSGALGSMVSTSSTAVAIDGVGVIAPNQFIVWGVQGTVVSDTAGKLGGVCQAEFQVF